MTNKTYQSWVRATGVAAGLMLLAACGDSGDKTEATSAASGDPIDVVAYGEGQEGTWGDVVYGNPDAPVTVVEYASLVCGHCANYAKNEFPQVDEKYIQTGKIKFVYRNFLLGKLDMVASAVARCGTEEETKKLNKLFFDRQYEWSRSEDPSGALASLARRAVNMSRVKFDRCVANSDMHKNLVQMTKVAQNDFGINSTPSFIVNGEKLEFSTFEELREQLDEAIENGS